MPKVEAWQLKQRQGQSLEIKVQLSIARIRAWYEHWGGEVFVSFSGGMDSTVLLHLVRIGIPEVLDYIGVSYEMPNQPHLFELATSGVMLPTEELQKVRSGF